jgi:simple sugar transport system permease protein
MKIRLFKSYEFFLVLLLIFVSLTIGLINPAFFSIGTFFDIVRIQTVYILLGFGLLPVLILGGVDISFVAIAAISTFPVHMWLQKMGYDGGIWVYYFLCTIVGLSVGGLIGWLLGTYKLQIFDLSLGMNTLLYGFVLFFVGSLADFNMPKGMVGWNKNYLIIVNSVVGESGLHISFLSIIVAGAFLHFLLKYTTIGRAIYAIGSNKSVAIRTGFNLKKVYLVVFPIMGALSAIAGLTQSVLLAYFPPTLFLGKNMQVLAAVVLGGASVTGGRGSVIGVFLGTLLVGLVNQALVYLGISTQWYEAVIGAIFIVYATFQSVTNRQELI